jgi:hypothetical protein
MKKFKLVDYIEHLRPKFDHIDPLVGSLLTPQNIIDKYNEAISNGKDPNTVTGYIWSDDGKIEYYYAHKLYGVEFGKVIRDLTDFLYKYSDVPKNLMTASSSNQDFPFISIASNDEKEVFEWKRKKSDDVRIPMPCDSLMHKSGIGIVKNSNWRELEDPNRANRDGFYIERDGKVYSDENQAPMDILKAYLNDREVLFLSNVESDLLNSSEIGDKKVSFIKFPSLHPRVTTYIGLLKKYFGLILKIEKVRYNSIDIIPISNDDIAIFVSSNDADTINRSFRGSKELTEFPRSGYTGDNIMSRIGEEYKRLESIIVGDGADEDELTNDHLYFTFYKRDRNLRFQSIISSRLKRITSDISSLNKLHNPTNYKFEQDDFNKAKIRIQDAAKEFERTYSSYFSKKNITKSKQELAEDIRIITEQFGAKEVEKALSAVTKKKKDY